MPSFVLLMLKKNQVHNISKDREIPFSHFCYCSKIKFDNNCTNYLIYSLSR